MSLQLTSALPGWSVSIHAEEAAVQRKTAALFPSFLQKDMPDTGTSDIIVSRNGDVSYGTRRYTAVKQHETLFYIYEGVDYLTKNHMLPFTMLHGGAVSIAGQAIGLLAPTHTGKSTLVAELLLHGAQFLCDDYLLVDDQLRAHPFPLPLRLRELSILSSPGSFSKLHEGVHPYSGEQEYIMDIRPYEGKAPVPLMAIFLLRRQSCTAPSLHCFSNVQAYKTLVQNGKSPREAAIRQVALAAMRITSLLPVYELMFYNLGQGAALLWETVVAGRSTLHER